MNLSEFEKELQCHADRVKSAITPPFNIEREEFIMTDKKFSVKKAAILLAAVICIIGTTVFAAIHFLTPEEVAQNFGDEKLAEAFGDNNYDAQSVTDGKYSAALLGVVSGRDLSDFKQSVSDIIPERTYAVVAVERTDKTPMTVGEPIMVTPLIQHLKPWQYNIASMHGGYTEDVIDGVLYRLIEMDSIECFAEQQIYMAVTDSMFIDNKPFAIDEETGEISANEEYDGTNILFELNVDKSKADREKAEQYLIMLKEEWEFNGSEDNAENEAEPDEEPELITLQ